MVPYTSCSGRSSISRSLAIVSNTVTHAASNAIRFTSCATLDFDDAWDSDDSLHTPSGSLVAGIDV
jgi:hypothetical protein